MTNTIRQLKDEDGINLISIHTYETKGAGNAYKLIANNANALISDSFLYQGQARAVGQSIILALGLKLSESDVSKLRLHFKQSLIDYIFFYVISEIKKPQTYDDFISSPDYEAITNERLHRKIHQESQQGQSQRLSKGPQSLVCLPKEQGSLGSDIRRHLHRIDGDCKSICLIHDK